MNNIMHFLRHSPLPLLTLVLVQGSQCRLVADDYDQTIRPILAERCVSCHSTKKQKGDLDLERFKSMADVKKEPLVWENVQDQIQSGEMPPKKEPQLSQAEKAKLTQWAQTTLDEIALASAGDPGPVVLRRLSNMEYTYTVRDLTGVGSLDPAKEFPVDGAAGEGFTNAGAALVMSPALLTKYLDAAKDIASHAVLTPNGIRFSASNSARDWTDETMAKIRAIYERYTESGTAEGVTQQGIKLDTGAGGRLPLAKYLAALQGKGSADGLNAKYLAMLRAAFADKAPSMVLDGLREKFRAGILAPADVEAWQQSLWRFATVGHIGKKNGPKAWQEPVTPLVAAHEMRVKLSAPTDGSDVTLYLATGDAGDGSENDSVVWENPRIVVPGRADLALGAVPSVVDQMSKQREAMIGSVTQCLTAADEAEHGHERTNVAKLAQKHDLDAAVLAGWIDYLGVGSNGDARLGPLISRKMESTPAYDFVKGWTGDNALSVLANSSDKTVKTPGTMKPHSVATHPSPKFASVIAWRSPVAGALRVSGSVQDAHIDCGNGITWALELRRGHTRDVLASGVSEGARVIEMGSHDKLQVQKGDVIAVVIGPRDGSHSCDLTAVELIINDGTNEWSLSKDISPNILAGNPHADSHGNKDVWHFTSEPASAESASIIPQGSVVSLWRKASDTTERQRLAKQVQELLQRDAASLAKDSPDRALRAQLLAFNGPLLGAALKAVRATASTSSELRAQAPGVIEVKLPASLVEGAEFVVTGKLASAEGSVQMQVLTRKPEKLTGLVSMTAESALEKGNWSDNNLHTMHSAPVIVNDGSATRGRFEKPLLTSAPCFPSRCATRRSCLWMRW